MTETKTLKRFELKKTSVVTTVNKKVILAESEDEARKNSFCEPGMIERDDFRANNFPVTIVETLEITPVTE